MRALVLSILLLFWGGAAAAQPAPAPSEAARTLDAAARDYVALILEIGEHEDGYVDAYYGPPEWLAAAKANPRSVADLTQAAAALSDRIAGAPDADLDAMERQRKKYLLAHVSAAAARLRMISGQVMGFADEAEALFGVRPDLPPLESFDPVLAELETLVPGEGPLGERITAMRAHYVIPKDRLDAVMRTAIAECRARTARRIALPDNERFTLEFVTDKPWSGYNYYKGDAESLIQINTDLPIYIDRAVDLGCHEGYPGHHVYNALLEQAFVRDRGWVEMSVYPLFSPMSLIAEGSANYGIDLAFPGHERTEYEARVLYPLAGLDPATAEDGGRLVALADRLKPAEYTIADDFLSGRVGREETLERIQKYGLADRARAIQRLSFIETYRSYVINYGLGRDMVRDWVARQGQDHWLGMKTLLASQTLPVDLAD
ncbi:MAG: hypothetical protein KF910_11370 [Brevundimonas sp.]|uniref:hypothetical protein n=1 Tax=Brevundimonas sp. TaxID=1871086 RepID=UPI0025C3DE0D|nr:hypothetical protein [Brevundimonas sp.]MBX3478201.1 hypothetical protein [Brevundimonas sp.]